LKGADVQKDIRTAGVVPDETEAAIGIPHFQRSGSHPIFPSPSVPIDRAVAFIGKHWLIVSHFDKAHFGQGPEIVRTDGRQRTTIS
jgi:hypothetical protein